MDSFIIELIKVKRPLYSNDQYFLFNECSNIFKSDQHFLDFIHNQAHILLIIISNSKVFFPIFQMANVYFFNRANVLLL